MLQGSKFVQLQSFVVLLNATVKQQSTPTLCLLPLLPTPACLVWFFGAKFSLENKLLLAQDTLVFLFLLALPALAVLAGHVPVHGGDVAS